MAEYSIDDLEELLQKCADSSYRHTVPLGKNPNDVSCNSNTFAFHFQQQLRTNEVKLSQILDSLAQQECDKLLEIQVHQDFSHYIRNSFDYPGYVEVFTGTEWILVPESADVCYSSTQVTLFNGSTKPGFELTITDASTGDYHHFTSSVPEDEYFGSTFSQGYNQLEIEYNYADQQRQTYSVWDEAVIPALKFSEKQINFVDDIATGYTAVPKDIQRTYAYRISKTSKHFKTPLKAGKIYQKGQKLAKIGRRAGPIGGFLTAGTIGIEIGTDTWDAHTFVDAALLVVSIAALTTGGGVILAGIAIYGIVDYFFDVGEGLDATIGRNSGFWDQKEHINKFPTRPEPLFRKFEIDNTYVAPKKLIDPNKL